MTSHGTCPVCGKRCALLVKSGRIRRHPRKAEMVGGYVCPGSLCAPAIENVSRKTLEIDA